MKVKYRLALVLAVIASLACVAASASRASIIVTYPCPTGWHANYVLIGAYVVEECVPNNPPI